MWAILLDTDQAEANIYVELSVPGVMCVPIVLLERNLNRPIRCSCWCRAWVSEEVSIPSSIYNWKQANTQELAYNNSSRMH